MIPRSILLIDDDPSILYLHSRYFQGEGWEVFRAMSGEDGLELYATNLPDLVLLDLNLPGIPGLQVLEKLVAEGATVIMLTAHGDLETAVTAMRMGAENFVSKPAKLAHLATMAERAIEKVELRRTNELLAGQLGQGPGAIRMGSSPAMQSLARQVELLAASDQTTVLLQGESGTGKGWVAQTLHARSPRAKGPFVEVNCAGLSATFLDSELFGHESGAFTGAKSMKRGLFEVAHGGTLFLDEVGDLAAELQPKLLKVLEQKVFRRLGGTVELRTDVRLIAATNKDLKREIATGGFREDLYYRLNVLPLHLPALRERTTGDVLELIQHLLRDIAARHPGAPIRVADRALALLVRFDWPGNVRQLANVLERAVVISAGADQIQPEHLPAEVRQSEWGAPHDSASGHVSLSLREVERRHIERTLLALGGNRTHAAAALEISRATLHNKIREYGLEQIGRIPS